MVKQESESLLIVETQIIVWEGFAFCGKCKIHLGKNKQEFRHTVVKCKRFRRATKLSLNKTDVTNVILIFPPYISLYVVFKLKKLLSATHRHFTGLLFFIKINVRDFNQTALQVIYINNEMLQFYTKLLILIYLKYICIIRNIFK